VVSPGAGVPAGSVIFSVDGVDQPTVPLSAGKATLTLSTLGAGTHTILARFVGTADFNISTAALGQQVNGAPTTIAFSASSVTAQGVTLTATVQSSVPSAGNPTGTVIFLVDGSVVGSAPVVNGVAVFTTTHLSAGNHSFSAAYAGSGGAAGAASASTAQV